MYSCNFKDLHTLYPKFKRFSNLENITLKCKDFKQTLFIDIWTYKKLLLPHLCWPLLQIGRHLHTAFIKESELSEQQRKLSQVFLEFPKAVLVHHLTLGHTIGKLNQKYKASLISLSVYNISGLDCRIKSSSLAEEMSLSLHESVALS